MILSLYSVGTMAQGVDDIFRLSFQNTSYGTARNVSLGGAFGALGADFSSLSNNPAGLAMYRSSEFTLTPILKTRIDNTNYIGSDYADSRTRFMFDNFGLVSSFKSVKKTEEEKGLVMLNFGLGYNRVKDFYSETTLLGLNNSYSIMNHFADLANGYHWADLTPDKDWDPYKNSNAWWEAIMAWNTYLIDTLNGKPSQYQPILAHGDGVYQDQSHSVEGGIGEYTFSMGANVSNKYYFGATIGVHDVFMRYYTYYTETAKEGNSTAGDIYFKGMTFNERLLIEGSGINLKLGFIYRPIPQLRLGLAAHTPTFYSLDEKYRATMSSELNVGEISTKTPTNYYDYTLETPYKFIGSVAYTFGQIALISADYEYVDYTSMRYGKGGDGYKFTGENQSIKNIFVNVHNVRVGGEVWIGQLALRAGYAYYGSPYDKNYPLATSATNVFSGGFGLRMDHFYVDWAYQRMMYDYSFMPFGNFDKLSNYPEIATSTANQNRFMLTLGYRF